MRSHFIAALVLFGAGAQFAQAQPIAGLAAKIQVAKAAIAKTLRDPGSATYRDVWIQRLPKGVGFCGEVNSRNVYGGYAGFTGFVAIGDAVMVDGPDSMRHAAFENAYDQVCLEQSRRIFKCKQCERQFSLTSGTLFASHKMSMRDILVAIATFVNGANGYAALHLARDLKCSYKTAFVLLHKLRRAIGDVQEQNALTGDVEIDGIYFGGYIREKNMKIERTDRRKRYNERRRAIVTIRERRVGGRSRAIVVQQEKDSVPTILETVHPSADLITDLGTSWGKLFLQYNDHKTVNHTLGHVIDGIHINGVEGQNARIRRAEIGVYLHINSRHAQAYADELSWRDDYRRVSNGQQYQALLGQASRPRQKREWWHGYWQKRPKPEGAASAA